MKKVMLTLAVVSAMALPIMAEEACTTNKVEKKEAAVKCTDASKDAAKAAQPAEAAKPAEAAPAKAE